MHHSILGSALINTGFINYSEDEKEQLKYRLVKDKEDIEEQRQAAEPHNSRHNLMFANKSKCTVDGIISITFRHPRLCSLWIEC